MLGLTFLVTVARMGEKGYVWSRVEPQAAGAVGLPRRLYRPTPLGLRVPEAWTMAARMLTSPHPQET